MAEIVLGMATSHGPMLSTPWKEWGQRVGADRQNEAHPFRGRTYTFDELIADTQWENYGRASGNSKCQQCMVHCGYEPTAVDATFASFGGLFGTIKAMIFNRYANPSAGRRLTEEAKRPHGPFARLVELGLADDVKPAAKAAAGAA